MTSVPGRPDHHDDFWLLSEIVIDTDAQIDNHTATFDEIVSRYIPPEVLIYFARQRAERLTAQGIPQHLGPALGSLWLDGFLAGAQYQSRKTT